MQRSCKCIYVEWCDMRDMWRTELFYSVKYLSRYMTVAGDICTPCSVGMRVCLGTICVCSNSVYYGCSIRNSVLDDEWRVSCSKIG